MLFLNIITLWKMIPGLILLFVMHCLALPFSLPSLSQKNSKMEKVSATSWRFGPMAHVDGKRKWWPQQTPPPINTEMRPSPLSPRLRCGWGCITIKETGPSAGWLLCSLQKEVRVRCVPWLMGFIAVLYNFNNVQLNSTDGVSRIFELHHTTANPGLWMDVFIFCWKIWTFCVHILRYGYYRKVKMQNPK